MPVILITGASSGIGAALARHYAGAGTTLILQGRDRIRLDAIAEACRTKGSDVETRRIDIRERAAVADWLQGADRAHSLDLVIVNAAINGGDPGATWRPRPWRSRPWR